MAVGRTFLNSSGLLALVIAGSLSPRALAQQAISGPVAADKDDLAISFRDPPQSARPRVWWHWVNANISIDGVEKDLEWLARIGAGGAQAFDVARPMPLIVDNPVAYMSPEWRAAFRAAASKADALGLELGIASSPGWSETGGPWVKPEDAMKKLVWSETDVVGGKRFNGVLAAPPSVSGPFQELTGDEHHGTIAGQFYRDASVVAVWRGSLGGVAQAVEVLVNGAAIDGKVLQDGRLKEGIQLPASAGAAPGSLEYVFARPTTIRSARLFIADLPNSALSGPLRPRLEASDDGEKWRAIATVAPSTVPSTVSFTPVTARRFRLLMTRERGGPPPFMPAPGVDLRMVGSLGGGPKKPVLAEFQLSAEPRINAFERKAAYSYADNYYELDSQVGDDIAGPEPASTVDLTARMDREGRLDWNPPKGNWRVLRIGYSLTGKTNAPATPEATGLEADKYDRGAVERYLDHYLQTYRAAAGPALIGRHGVTSLVTDSIEVRPANWTPDFAAKFQRLRGYDPRPWLPALTGMIIGSRKRSDAFLYDFRKTLGELTETEHYGTIARVARREGLTVYGEALEGNREISALGDDLDLRRHADIPMGAMWTFRTSDAAPQYRADMRGAASVAHLYGKPFVAAELLTSILQPWAYAPSDLQPMIDAAFLAGVNRPVIHSVVHQPRDDRKPGLSLEGFGQFFGRHEAWAELARPWMDYLARNSFLLQQGRNVADVAYFYGEDTPISVIAAKEYPDDVPARHAYDFISAEGLSELTVQKGELVSRGGARYRAIYLGGTSARMTLPVLARLTELVEAGATVIGDAPVSSPSLLDDRTRFDALVKRLWSSRPGAGRVLSAKNIDSALAAMNVAPDFSVSGAGEGADIQFVHRTLADGEIYFVANRRAGAERVDARFRVTGYVPHIWRADTGSVSAVSYRIDGEHTVVPLELGPNESFFVVFRQRTNATQQIVAKSVSRKLLDLDGPWHVSFEPGRGAPPAIRLNNLTSLSENAAPGVKYFSGLATYEKRIMVPRTAGSGDALILDLGRLGDIAEVAVNGKRAGWAWKAPYRVDITRFVRPGANDLRIRVANLWVNRLIGDQQPGAEKTTWTAIATYTAKAPLRPSGLIGPVALFEETKAD